MNAIRLNESFDMIVPHTGAFAHSFYEHLFMEYPQTQPLFAQTNMRRQVGALLATLDDGGSGSSTRRQPGSSTPTAWAETQKLRGKSRILSFLQSSAA